MDGLEAVEIRLSQTLENKDFRHDSNFWTTVIYKNPTLEYDKIGNRLVKSQYGISISMNEDGVGIPIYRMNEIHNMLCNSNVDKCAELSVDELETFKLNNRDVLFNRTNSFEWVGRTGVYYQNSTQPFVFASYLVRFVPNETVLPEYLTAFLSCKFGVTAIKARARESINQANVNPEEVKEIEIPVLSSGLQNEIANCFIKANDDILKSESLYVEAEQILLSYLRFDRTVQNPTSTAIKSFKDSFGVSGRLDSEYYQPKYEMFENIIKNSPCGYCLVSDEFVHIKTKCNKDLLEYPYIEIGDIDTNNGSVIANVIATQNLPDNAKIMAQKGDILISTVRPNRGAVSILESESNLVSGAFVVLRQKGVYSKEVLQVLFRTEIYKDWLLKYNVGTSYPVIKSDAVLNIPLPKLEESIQLEISQMIQESFALRKKSAELLELAKTAVEIAIEHREEESLKYLKEKGVEV